MNGNFIPGVKYFVDGKTLNEIYEKLGMKKGEEGKGAPKPVPARNLNIKGTKNQIAVEDQGEAKVIRFDNFAKVYIIQNGAAAPVFLPFWDAPEDA